MEQQEFVRKLTGPKLDAATPFEAWRETEVMITKLCLGTTAKTKVCSSIYDPF